MIKMKMDGKKLNLFKEIHLLIKNNKFLISKKIFKIDQKNNNFNPMIRMRIGMKIIYMIDEKKNKIIILLYQEKEMADIMKEEILLKIL
jgi:mRNA-degrading endonuclease RelE of RelBE toxin-antitoxin system